jgi:hypothetical protein
MERSPRAEALHLLKNSEEIAPPVMPDLEPDSPEALNFLGGIKEAHYASMAITIELLFDKVMAKRSDEPPYGLPEDQPLYVKRVGWEKVAGDFRSLFLSARSEIKETPAYKNTERFTKLIGTLDGDRYINLLWQIDGGINTGMGSILTLLRNAPNIIDSHDPSNDLSPGDVMRHPQSKSLLKRLASVSINQMMAAQSALAGESEHQSWGRIDQVLDPSHFQLRYYDDGSKSLGYGDFNSLTVPSGFTPHHTVPPVDQETLVTDIPNHQPKIVGCPVTLLKGRMAELLDWSIDVVEAEDLWDEDWPPLNS